MRMRDVGRGAMVLVAMALAACSGNRPSEGALPEELEATEPPVVLPAGVQGAYAGTVALPTAQPRSVRLELRGGNGAVYRTADAGAAPVERVGRYRGVDSMHLEVDLPAPMGESGRDTLYFRIDGAALVAIPAADADYVGDLILRKEGGMDVGGGTGTQSRLRGTSWTLVELDGRPALPGPGGGAPTLAFEATGEPRASGDAGCNRYGGPYTHAGTTLRFGPLASTKRACADDALNSQETAFLGALADVTRAVVSTDRLDLFAGDRLVARLRSAPR